MGGDFGQGIKGWEEMKIELVRKWYSEKNIQSAAVGAIKRECYEFLYKIMKFSPWHTTPINEREYAIDLVHDLNNICHGSEFRTLVEIGCGIGDIVANVRAKEKIGYDTENAILSAGRLVHPTVTFKRGSFADVVEGEIDCLLMVNFIHDIGLENLRESIHQMLKNNKVKMFVIDSVQGIAGTEYKYSHKGELLFGNEYACIKRSRGYEAASGARRVLEYWRKI